MKKRFFFRFELFVNITMNLVRWIELQNKINGINSLWKRDIVRNSLNDSWCVQPIEIALFVTWLCLSTCIDLNEVIIIYQEYYWCIIFFLINKKNSWILNTLIYFFIIHYIKNQLLFNQYTYFFQTKIFIRDKNEWNVALDRGPLFIDRK